MMEYNKEIYLKVIISAWSRLCKNKGGWSL